MMQFARRASLAVVLLLLAALGTASAECAWVLWGFPGTEMYDPPEPGQTPGPLKRTTRPFTPPRDPFIIAAFQTRAECMAQPDITHKNLVREARDPQGSVVFVDYAAKCLPDTIDPRGPKR